MQRAPLTTVYGDTPLLALAPMQDVTDLSFLRTLQRLHCLPDFVVTPYLRSATTSCVMSDSIIRCITENPTSCPIWVQLAGSEAEPLLRDVKTLNEFPVAGFNLNVGCPSPLVNRHGAGAALLKNPAHLQCICCAMRDAISLGRWSVKCRVGWESSGEFSQILSAICASSPDLFIVHARTRRQMYAGKPDDASVRLAVQQASCPVLANGDISSRTDAAHRLLSTRTHGVMIGRGIVRNPYLFRELRGGVAPSRDEMLLYYITLLEETGRELLHPSPAAHCNRMKKFLAFCYEDFSPQAKYTLRRCTSPFEMEKTLLLAANKIPSDREISGKKPTRNTP